MKYDYVNKNWSEAQRYSAMASAEFQGTYFSV